MVDKLVEALAENMKARWGEEYKIYTENVYQNAVKPCFFIECENVQKVQLLGGRFFLRVEMKVVFDSDSDQKKLEGDKIIGELFVMMNCIKKDDRVYNGRKIHCNKENGNLTVRGVYDLFIRKEEEGYDMMESVEIKGEI